MAFNDQQLEAINSNARTILCLAGAGAGKSTTMVNRILRKVNEGVDPSRILALTFTNAAAFEMGEKYRKLPGAHGTAPEFRTFHSFCYSLLIKDKSIRERLGYSSVPTICDDNKLKQLKENAKLKIGCKLSDNKLASPKTLTKQEKFEYDLFIKAYKKEVREANVITFDLLSKNVCELFTRNEPEADKYKNKYQILVVDEFQDSDPIQFKFIASFPETTSLFLVGDCLQNIYGFRGCSNTYIKMLAEDPNWEVIKLYKNYRSTRQICDFANKMSKYAKSNYRIEMEGLRDGEKVNVVFGSHVDYLHPVDEDHLSILIDNIKKNDRETAVLCRSNKEVKAVGQALDAANIAYSTSNKSTDVLDILNSTLDNEYMLNWLATFLDTVEYGDYIRASSLVENPDIRWFLNNYGSHKKIRESGKKIIEIRRMMNSKRDSYSKFNDITKLLKIKSRCKFDKSDELSNTELVASIRDQIAQQEDTQVYVGTIHSSKGLEYDTVYVMGVDDNMFRLDSEDSLNLYYVAITRAKNHLTIFRR